MQPLRVLHLVLSLETGGTEKLVSDVVRHLDRQAISSYIGCLDRIGTFGEQLQQEGYPFHLLHRIPGIDWALGQRLGQFVQQEQIDVIHAHQYTPFFYALLGVLYVKFTRFGRAAPKLIVTEHGIPYPFQKKWSHLLLNPLLFWWADEIITIAEYTKRILMTYENYPARRTKVIYNGINLTAFAQPVDVPAKKASLGIPPQANVIGIVARLDPVKNHALLFRAFKTVLATLPNTYLLVIGDGPERQALYAQVESSGLFPHTMFLGNRNDVPELLHILDVLALSSFSEGMSVTLIEAMGAGIPVVATRVGGNAEVVDDGETGMLVANDHEQEMAQALLSLLGDPEKRHRMGQAGQRKAQTMFSLEKTIAQYTTLYHSVCGR